MVFPSGWIGLFLCVASVASVQPAQADDRFNFFDVELVADLWGSGDNNVLVSPASVKTLLTAIVEGTGGRTFTEIVNALRLPSDIEGIRTAAARSLAPFKTRRVGAELDLATRIWTGHNVEINSTYRDSLRRNYESDIQSVDFQDSATSANIINEWVRQQTRGHIPSIVTPGSVSTGTKLLLTNALFLKGVWKTAFDQTLTSVHCFHLQNGECQNAHFMYSLGYYRYAYIPSLHSEVLELPYTDPKLSMLIILPVNKDGGVKQVARDLTHTSMSSITNSITETEIRVALPRFSIESKLDLRPTLESLGIKDLFDANADLSGIINGAVQVGNVLHNTRIVVNENGTIAAAVTAAAVVPLMGSTVQRFVLDRPFVFLIRDADNGCILFAGRVMEPDVAPNQGSGTNATYRRRA